MDTWERAQAGLFLALQYPTEVPGRLGRGRARGLLRRRRPRPGRGGRRPCWPRPGRIGFAERFLGRDLNVDLSGGEKKRNETLQLGVLEPKIAILDELDSGLDVDALRACSRRVEQATTETGLGVLAITHYTRLLRELKPDVVHILAKGQIVKTGGPELADELETDGYAAYLPSGEADRPTSAAIRSPTRSPIPSLAEPAPGVPVGSAPVHRLRDLDGRQVLVAAAMVVLVLVPFGASAVRAHHVGWLPSGDDALIGLRTHDVLTSERPVLGQPSTSHLYGHEAGTSHPGPIEFYWLAAPLRLLGPSVGMISGILVVNLAAVLVAAWVVLRRAGPTVAGWAMVLLSRCCGARAPRS